MKIFIHGWESSNQGTKSVFFRERYPDMIIPNFTGNLPHRIEKLDEILFEKTGLRLVGSSFGGLMGTIFTLENESLVEKLVLLAPAIHLMADMATIKKKISVPVFIYHGYHDEVIPLEKVEDIARRLFTNLSFQKVKDDHFLHRTFKTIDWEDHLIG